MTALTRPPLVRRIVYLYGLVVSLVVVLMIFLGVLMRLSQGGWPPSIPPNLLYQIMTAHYPSCAC